MIGDPVTLETLIRKINTYDHNTDQKLLRKAYFFSSDAHCSQRRQEGTPFIKHPLSVASILADMHLDSKAIIAGLLHDTIEDAEISLDDIRDIFGKDVSFIVDSLTKLNRAEAQTKEDVEAENLRRMLLAMSKDVRVIMIKFADRLHNMKTLQYLPEKKQKRIATETLDIYAPIANRLGIGWLRTEFEDLSFKYLYPELYDEIVKKVAKKRKSFEIYIKEVAKILGKKIKEEGLYGKISGRVKHYYGIYQKMQRRRATFEEIQDILGLRITTKSKYDCYAILGLIHSLWRPVPGRFKDYIALPKSNMYQSLHTTVIGPKGERVELQIRTEKMHFIAEEGIASHWIYKENDKIKDKDTDYILWLRDLIRSQSEMTDAKEFLEMVKGEVFPEAIYILTPQGEIKELPLGATPVDLAYSIHTEIGDKCVGARVNGRIIPLRYQLKSGDTVEIITSKNHSPSKDWLSFVVTHKAKNKIKHWIKTEERKHGIELGTKMLKDELKKHGHRASYLKLPRMKDIARSFKLSSPEDLLSLIGHGNISTQQVINKIVDREYPEEVHVFSKLVKNIIKKTRKGIKIEGIDNILCNTAKCCYPVPSDNLVGFISKGRGISIHRKECTNYQRFDMDESRLINVSWKPDKETTSSARLYVETVDKPGILANISSLISSLKINLSHIDANVSQDKHAHFTFILEVNDSSQITSVIQKMLSSDGVIRVQRM